MARYHSKEIRVTCEGYCGVDEFDTEVLVEELKRRKQEVEIKHEMDDLVEVHEAICGRQYDYAQLLLERMIWPKWKSVERCMEAFAAATNTAPKTY